MLKIYVGCSLTQAPEAFKQEVERLKRHLSELPGIEVLEFIGLVNGTSADVYKMDLGNVERCGVLIAIADYASIGLGMEIQHGRFFKKPTLCLHHEDVRVTRMLHGAQEFGYLTLRTYRVLSADGFHIVQEYLKRQTQLVAAD